MPHEPRLLAIDGGAPALGDGPPDWPPGDEAVRQALEQAFRTGDWGRYHGANHAALVAAMSAWLAIEHVQLCCSGTVAVELALRGVGVQADDEVVLAAYDFPGNFRAIEAIGARPVLVDIDPETWCLAAEGFQQAINERPSRIRAVIVSHLHGGLADIAEIAAAARSHEIAIVEDACQCPGAVVAGKLAGTHGEVGVFSFGGSKLLTSGRGGAIVTQDATIAQRARIYSDRGNAAVPLSELQAAVLLPQLEGLPERNDIRGLNARRLLNSLQGICGLKTVRAVPTDTPAYYKIAISFSDTNTTSSQRDAFVAAARAEGIDLGPGFRGFATRSPRRCRRFGDLSHSRCASNATMLLHHPVLLQSAETVSRVASTLGEIAQRLASPGNASRGGETRNHRT